LGRYGLRNGKGVRNMNLRQGSLRLLITLVALLFVYWSSAFVFVSASNTSTALPGLKQLPVVVDIALACGAVLGVWWTVLGFRSG
jgi:hypothetical protein